MLTRHYVSSILIVQAMVATYARSSKAFYRTKKNHILVASFLLAPLASIPEALLSPYFLLGEETVRWWVRCSAFGCHACIWHVWISSHRRFIPLISSFFQLYPRLPYVVRGALACCRYGIFSWPVVAICVAMYAVDRHRAFASQWYVLGGFVLACIVVAISSRGRSVSKTEWTFIRFRCGLILWQAVQDVASWRHSANAMRHVCIFFAIALSHTVALRSGLAGGASWVVLLGSFAGFLSVRGLVDAASDRTFSECPVLLQCARYSDLVLARVVVAIVVFILISAACMLVSDVAYGLGGEVMVWLAIRIGLIVAIFILCRVFVECRRVEGALLWIFLAIGMGMECI